MIKAYKESLLFGSIPCVMTSSTFWPWILAMKPNAEKIVTAAKRLVKLLVTVMLKVSL